MAFVVVHFLETDEVAIINQSWLIDENTCKWPPYENEILIKRALLGKKAPENNWKSHEIFILGVHKTYAGAKKEVDSALHSDSDDDDKTPERKRQKVQSILNNPASSMPIVIVKSEHVDCNPSSETVFVPQQNVELFSTTPLQCNYITESQNYSEFTVVNDSNANLSSDNSLNNMQVQCTLTSSAVGIRTEDSAISLLSLRNSSSENMKKSFLSEDQSQHPPENFQSAGKGSDCEILEKESSMEHVMGSIEQAKSSIGCSLQESSTEHVMGSIEQAKSSTGCSLQDTYEMHSILTKSLSQSSVVSSLDMGTSNNTEVYMMPVQPSSYMASVPSTSSTTLDTIASLLPEKLPRAIEMAMQQEKLTQNEQNVVVRAIADRCYAAETPSRVINLVADLAVERWSPLRSAEYGQKSKSLAIQIKRRVSKLKACKGPKQVEDTENKDDLEAHNLAVKVMQEEMQNNNPCQTKLKNCLTTLRKERMRLASQMSASAHLNVYPAFKIQDLLLWEFSQLVNISEEELQSNWNCCVDATSRYLEGTVNAMPTECVSYDMKTAHILLVLPSLLKSGKRTKERTKFIIEIFEDGTSLHTILPALDEPPRLIAIGSKKNPDLDVTCYVDGKPLFVSKAVKGLLLLVATYWVFDMKFPVECRPSFLFVSAALLKHAFISKELQNCGPVLRLLKQLK